MQPDFLIVSTSQREMLLRQPRLQDALDVADVVAVAKVLVDEAVEIAELQLDGGAHVVEPRDPAVLADDLQTALEAALVVAGNLQHEEILEDVSIHGVAGSL